MIAATARALEAHLEAPSLNARRVQETLAKRAADAVSSTSSAPQWSPAKMPHVAAKVGPPKPSVDAVASALMGRHGALSPAAPHAAAGVITQIPDRAGVSVPSAPHAPVPSNG
jgi:hypothetical protein